jgi:hypothetical protein
MQPQQDPDLPDALNDEEFSASEDRAQRLRDLSLLLVGKRREAVDGRASSGIEEIWTEDEEAYEGIDDANRTESRVMKPTSTSGGLMRTRATSVTRSTVFIRLTTQYVDSAAARVSDMLLPTDDRCFEIKATPVPDLVDLLDNPTPVTQNGLPAIRPATPQDTNVIAGPNNIPAVRITVGDKAQEELDRANESAKKAQTQIDDWLVECQWHAEKRKSIHDRAKLGVSVMKGPFPQKKRSTKMLHKDGQAALVVLEEVKPASKRIDPWNFYPDPACGEDIHNGNFTFEKDFLTDKQLRALIGVPGYLEEEIRACLEEGPQKAYAEGRKKNNAETDLYQVWYYHGEIKIADLRAAGYDFQGEDEGKSDDDSMPAVMTMVNDRVIKAALNILDSGSFPYDVCVWQVRSGSWVGIGVARQLREAQGGLNAAVRNLMDNAALSGGPMLIINRELLKPVDGTWNLTPRKVFETTSEADNNTDVSKAIVAVNIPSMQEELMQIIEFFLKMAEQTTGMPMLLQGQTGNAPDTLGGQLLANNNASTVLRRIARLDDDCSTEPHIRRYYEYLLLHGDDDSAKGNFQIDARGSSALVERDIQNHATLQILQFATNPAFGIDPYKAAAEAMKAQRLDPKRFQISEEEMEQRKKNPPPPAPVVQAAQVRAQSAIRIKQMDLQAESQSDARSGQPAAPDTSLQVAQIRRDTELTKAQINQQTDIEELKLRQAEAREQRAHELQMRTMEYEMRLMEFASNERISLADAKTRLADTSLKLTTQKELSSDAMAADLHKHHNPAPAVPEVAEPAIEPAGRAEPGNAFAA